MCVLGVFSLGYVRHTLNQSQRRFFIIRTIVIRDVSCYYHCLVSPFSSVSSTLHCHVTQLNIDESLTWGVQG